MDLQTILAKNSYYANVNQELLELIPKGIENVLEVGCADGNFGAAYKFKNPISTYIGIEIAPQPASEAAQKLDLVLNKPVEQVQFADLQLEQGKKLDCIIYGDVLEHLFNPWVTLKIHREWLAKAGTVVACVPNVGYWTVLYDLLHGRWKYGKSGVLDISHLRFFTRESICELFTSTGFKVVDVIGRPSEQAGEKGRIPHGDFLEAIKPAVIALNINWQNLTNDATCVQFMVTAKLL